MDRPPPLPPANDEGRTGEVKRAWDESRKPKRFGRRGRFFFPSRFRLGVRPPSLERGEGGDGPCDAGCTVLVQFFVLY